MEVDDSAIVVSPEKRESQHMKLPANYSRNRKKSSMNADKTEEKAVDDITDSYFREIETEDQSSETGENSVDRMDRKYLGRDTEVLQASEEEIDATNTTPLILRVSEDDESQDSYTTPQNVGDGARGHSLISSQDKLEDGKEISLKRKHYELRRSGSEECLLGFDEQSGEAELIKDDGSTLLYMSTEKSEYEEAPLSPTALSHAAKKLKQSPSSKSPKNEVQKMPSKVDDQAQHELDTKKFIARDGGASHDVGQPHIVGDNEETNGALNRISENSNITHPSVTATQMTIASKKPLSAQDDFYKKPFQYGWKRELVWRANMETSKDKADVYFIAPSGKKLRTRSDIVPLLEGELTIDHFCFSREPLGVGPEFETVRSAKPSSRVSVTAATLAAAPTPPNMGKRISKPKGPKGASPPPQGWTPTRALKVNNAALLSSAGSSRYGGGSHPLTPPSSRSAAGGNKTSKAKKVSATTAEYPSVRESNAAHEPCTMLCARASGQVPQLQCVKCLCLFHHECVGLNRNNCEYRVAGDGAAVGHKGREYVCETCLPAVDIKTKAPVRKVIAANAAKSESKYPQTIAVVKGKKYVMVAKPVVPSTEHANDIENDLKQINESIRNSRKPSAVSLDAAFQQHSTAVTAAVDQSNKLFATNFFANVSFAYDALLCILKYLKIHERPRAASVCKLWHLAAKDTSLWHTVRMKNSKVCNWGGFAAALRRGETKHLDLRKMLLTSTRVDEMWQDFTQHIGTVCSLEAIDLCRCSARVVESLFQSSKNLRVLNALAINDDTINLEHIAHLQELEEVRLRTCEPGVLVGDLQPLQTLTNLAHLSLTAIRGLGAQCVDVIGKLIGLRSLELGECGTFDSTFAQAVLPKLVNLQRLRLENGQETSCCTLEILEGCVHLEQLSQLELVNFDIKPGFDEKLLLCKPIRKLLIIPTYISQSATTNHIVLSAVQQVAGTLQVFTWGVTVELLRVTALYVDQCEESTKKEKHHFDECIPVLKPVPGAPLPDEDDEEGAVEQPKSDDVGPNEVPQIEILPLDKVECILGENLPHTKFTIVKVPYHATCKQQLVE